MYNFSFEYPYFLLLILLFLFCSFYCKAKAPSYLMPHLDIFQKVSKKSSLLINSLKYCVIIFSVIALASPVKINDEIHIKDSGINIILNLDASLSMSERDLESNGTKTRFESVKEIIKEFISKREADNIGMVLFGDSVLIASPLSFDKDAQKEMIDYYDVGMAGKNTAIIDSIASSINILKNKMAKSNIIILLSDGEDNSSTIPLDITIKLLKKYNMKVYTIGIGNFNNSLLSNLSNETNAKSYIAHSKEDLSLIYEDINKLEKSELDKNKLVLKDYLFFYPLFIAIFSLILLIFIRNKE